jgi:hypothetical protein
VNRGFILSALTTKIQCNLSTITTLATLENTMHWNLNLFSFSGEGGDTSSVGSLRKSYNLNHWMTHLTRSDADSSEEVKML